MEPPPRASASRGTASGTAALSSVRTAGGLSAATSWSTAMAAGPGRRMTASDAASEPAVRLWLVPGRLAVSAGDTFEVRVQAEAGQPVSHLPLTLSLRSRCWPSRRSRPATSWALPGTAQVMADAAQPGALVIGASRLGKAPGVRGDGTVARSPSAPSPPARRGSASRARRSTPLGRWPWPARRWWRSALHAARRTAPPRAAGSIAEPAGVKVDEEAEKTMLSAGAATPPSRGGLHPGRAGHGGGHPGARWRR